MKERPRKYVNSFFDRHGKPRYYLRRPGFKAVPLPGPSHSPQFKEAYEAAMACVEQLCEIGSGRTIPGTVNAGLVAYFNSAAWARLGEGTRRARRNILNHFREEHGDKRLAKLTSRPLMVIFSAKKSFAARNWLRAIRGFCQFCVDSGLLVSDPTAGIRLKSPKTAGFHSWTEGEIAQYERRHPIGTRARLALALLLYTAQRRSDIVRLGRQHEQDGVIITQQKTGTAVDIPIHPRLRSIIDATPSEHLTFLVTEKGSPFTAAGFGNWFADRCKEAGLPPKCRSHGLRKASCRRLAEAGCSASQISAISGHLSIREVQRYVEAADRKRLAREGMAKVVSAFPSENDQNKHSQTGTQFVKNRGKSL